MITNKQITDDSVIDLVSGLSFEGSWSDAGYVETIYDDKKNFRNGNNDWEDHITFLDNTGVGIFTDGKAKAFLKYYHCDDGAKQYAFMGILPNSNINLADYVVYLNSNGFDALWNSRDSQNYTVPFERIYPDGHTERYEKQIPCSEVVYRADIPKFKFDYSASGIIDYFQASGMKLPFYATNGRIPDYSNMGEIIDSSMSYLYISDVIHKTHVEIDEYGTNAVMIVPSPDDEEVLQEPVEEYQLLLNINLQRPFLFAIVDVEEGLPVLMGAVNTVKAYY